MLYKRVNLICCLLFIIFFQSIQCQINNQANNAFVSLSSQTAVAFYDSSLNKSDLFYNGSEYFEMTGNLKGHPYYESNYFKNGNVQFDGKSYDNILVLYNIISDELIIKYVNPSGSLVNMILRKDKINDFTVDSHCFINLPNDTLVVKTIPSGFYEMLFNGDIKVWAKRSKTKKEVVDPNKAYITFLENVQYQIYYQGVFYPVWSKRSVLNIFKEHKKEIKQFIRKSDIRFSRNREEAIIDVVRFCNNSNFSHD
jgi:hypothetical protein